MSNPFASVKSKPGHGTIHLATLPPKTPKLRTINYRYPLKLVAPAPLHAGDEIIHTVYVLTYGGGLVAGDQIDLNVIVEASSKLILLTQGSTKLFKTPDRNVVSKQCSSVNLAPDAALCYLPDPVQPFESSSFEQKQTYTISLADQASRSTGGLCVLDWVSNGRPANGENWSCLHYGSKNEVYLTRADGMRHLILRDNIVLDDGGEVESIATRMDGLGVFGTLILHGQLFDKLGQYFMDEFKALPRIGGRKWDSGSESGDEEVDPTIMQRLERQRRDSEARVLWSAAALRGCVVVKFGAREVEGARQWLRHMLQVEGSVVRYFGERALLCLR